MKTIVVSVALVVLAALVQTGKCVTCYQCTGMGDTDCGKGTLTEGYSRGGCEYCSLVYGKGEGGSSYVRNCIGFGVKPEMKCTDTEHGGYKGEACFCDTDLCNTATFTTVSLGGLACLLIANFL